MTINVAVATVSDNQSGPPERIFVDVCSVARPNMAFAKIHPLIAPSVWATMSASNSVIEPLFRMYPIIDTSGLKDAPDTGPKIVINAKSAPPVAIAFASNCSPTSSDIFCAMIPDPTTAITSKAVPKNSPRYRRFVSIPVDHSSCQRQALRA